MKKSLAILLILAFVSCQKNEHDKVDPKPFDIKNVKEWYNTKNSKAKINSKKPGNPEIIWERGKKGIHFTGAEMWMVPIEYDKGNYKLLLNLNKKELKSKIKFNGVDEIKNNFANEFLTIFSNKNGEYEIEKIITSEYSDKINKDKFEGVTYVFDEAENFKTGFIFENGMLTNTMSDSKKYKPNEITCTYLATHYFYVGGTLSNPSTNPQYSFTTYTLLTCTWDYPQGNFGNYATTLANSGTSANNSGYTNSFYGKDIVNNLKLKSPCAYEMVEYIRNDYTLNYIINSFNMGAVFQKFIYELEVGNNQNGQNAVTNWVGPGGIKTILDQNYLNTATKLSIFRTIVHETIHAYIIASNKTYGDFAVTYPQAWQDYLQNHDTNQAHHIAMMTNWRDRIAYMIQVWDNSRNDIQYYKDLSWGGIAIPGSQYFEQFVPYLYERDRIFNRLSNEASGIGGAKCN